MHYVECNCLNNYLIQYLKKETSLDWQEVCIPIEEGFLVAFWTPDIALSWSQDNLKELEDFRIQFIDKKTERSRCLDAIYLYSLESNYQKNIDFEALRECNALTKTVASGVLLELVEYMSTHNGSYPSKEQVEGIYRNFGNPENPFFKAIKKLHDSQNLELSSEYSKDSFPYRKQQSVKDKLEVKKGLLDNKNFGDQEIVFDVLK